MPFPVMLAGPILRRVEPTLVTVWVALREAGTLELTLWKGLVKDESSDTLFRGPDPVPQPEDPPTGEEIQEVKNALSKSSATIRIGDQLHVGVVTFKLPP